MHEYLFEHQKALEDADVKNYATQLGLDRRRFDRDWRATKAEKRIERDLASGEQGGVEGTPTFYLNASDTIRRMNHLDSLGSASTST